MRVTVAEPQGDAREGGAERSGRQTCDHRNTNRQRGRLRAASVLANTKPEVHQDAACRAGWHAGKVQALTRGDLLRESTGGVSRSHSSREQSRGPGTVRLTKLRYRNTPSCEGPKETAAALYGALCHGAKQPVRQQVPAARPALSEPVPSRRCSRRKREGEWNSRAHA
jgi:hypothetical protein